MAKRRINKSQAIRDDLHTHGTDSAPKDVVARLKARRITVSPAQVSMVKSKLRGSKTKTFSIDSLMEANRFVKRAGGIDAAKAALDVLAKLQ